MRKNNQKINWTSLSNDIGFIAKKRNFFQKKIVNFIAALTITASSILVGAYYFVNSANAALSLNDFKTRDIKFDNIDEFAIDMANINSFVSASESLRLLHIKNEIIKLFFAKMKTIKLWNSFFTVNPADYQFNWYNNEDSTPLAIEHVTKDGYCDIRLNILNKKFNISFQFNFPIFIYNNGIFIKKFMENTNFFKRLSHLLESEPSFLFSDSISQDAYKLMQTFINNYCKIYAREFLKNEIWPILVKKNTLVSLFQDKLITNQSLKDNDWKMLIKMKNNIISNDSDDDYNYTNNDSNKYIQLLNFLNQKCYIFFSPVDNNYLLNNIDNLNNITDKNFRFIPFQVKDVFFLL